MTGSSNPPVNGHKPPGDAPQAMTPRDPRRNIKWDDSALVTTFANVVNAMNTREDFALLFGVNQSWNAAEGEAMLVRLTHRIVLTPHAAKRISLLLNARIREYEARFGKLEL